MDLQVVISCYSKENHRNMATLYGLARVPLFDIIET